MRRPSSPEARRPLDRLSQKHGGPHPSHKSAPRHPRTWRQGQLIKDSNYIITVTHGNELKPGDSIIFYGSGRKGGKTLYTKTISGRWKVGHEIKPEPMYHFRHNSLALKVDMHNVGYGTALNYEYIDYIDNWINNQMMKLRGLSPVEKLVAIELIKSNDKAYLRSIEWFETRLNWYNTPLWIM